MNAQLREWISAVANQGAHGTTRKQVAVRWDVEQFSLHSILGRPSYSYVDGELRKVAREGVYGLARKPLFGDLAVIGKEVCVRQMAGVAGER